MPGLPLLDSLIADAWPAAVDEPLGGWRLRWTSGVTRRANSALTTGGTDIGGLVVAAERFYTERDASPLFQVSSASAPASLAGYLRTRGYAAADRTLVMHATTAAVLERPVPGTSVATVDDRVRDEWFAAYWSVETARGRSDADAAICRNVLLAPPHPTAFAGVLDGSTVVATGQIVIDAAHGWAGVQCMTTSPSHRRRGAASAVLHQLAGTARDAGVDRLYLAVMAANEGARALYRRSGFVTAHEYWYFSLA